MKNFQLIIKRLLDIILALFGFVVSLPLTIVGVAVVWFNSQGESVFFKQERAGLHGKPFYIYKIRTMTNELDETGKLLPDEKRLKKWGIFLRKTCIDEFPTFLNIIKGDMSMVGPRPQPVAYNDMCTPEQKKRLDMKPGIACLQTSIGTNKTDYATRYARDVWYVENFSLWLDFKYLVLTALKIFYRPFQKGDELSCDFDLGNQDKVRKS